MDKQIVQKNDPIIIFNTITNINIDNSNFEKYACFDLDHTLIRPKNGHIFPTNKDDWELISNVKDILNELYKNKWKIIIFTNQLGIDKKHITYEDLMIKFKNIVDEIGIEMYIIASIKKDIHRKPYLGMWNIVKNKFNIDLNNDYIFYCGDAYQIHDIKLRASDLKFAINIGITFLKPNDIFISIHKFKINEFTKNIQNNIENNQIIKFKNKLINERFNFINEDIYNNDYNKIKNYTIDFKFIFIISAPSSGKTTLSKNILENKFNYVRLSKDDYKTLLQYKKKVKEHLDNKDKIVFDNTNYKKKGREELIALIVKAGYKRNDIGYIYRNINKGDSMYLNKYRFYKTNGTHKLLPEVVIHSYYKNLELPEYNNYITVSNMIIGDILDKKVF